MIFNEPVERRCRRPDEQRGGIRRFEYEFKNNANHGIGDEPMSEDFAHHLAYQGLPPRRAGMRAVGEPHLPRG
jgi:hypothetical protein